MSTGRAIGQIIQYEANTHRPMNLRERRVAVVMGLAIGALLGALELIAIGLWPVVAGVVLVAIGLMVVVRRRRTRR